MPEAGFLPLLGAFAAGLFPARGLLPGAPEAALGLEPVLSVPQAGPALGREGIGLETGSLSKPDSLIHASTTSFESLSNLPRVKLEGKLIEP